MKNYIRRYRMYLIAFMCALFIAFSILGAVRWNNAPDNNVFEPADAGNNRACGPISLRIAAARLGKALDLTDLINACELTEKGASMFRLKQVAEMYGLQAEGVKLTWSDLVKLNTPVIIYVNNNHYCCVDPRERNPRNHKEVRMYRPGMASEWISKNDISTYWHGESLVIRRKEMAQAKKVPRLEFDTLLMDFGSTESCEMLRARFPFRNAGRAPLMINRIKKSCGCTSATASKPVLNPGEMAEITVLLSALGRAGYQNLSVYVESNDPISTTTELQYTGFINEKVHISKSILDYGDVYPGQTISQDIEVTERDGKHDLMIEGTEIKYEQIAKKEYTPVTEIKYVPEGKMKETVDLSWPAKRSIVSIDNTPIKYRVMIKTAIPDNEPYGPIRGTLEIATKVRGNPDIRIPVTMNIVSDIYIAPNNINVGVLKPNGNATKTFVVKRHSGKPVKIDKVFNKMDAQGPHISAKIEIIKEEIDQAIVELTVHRSNDEKAMNNVTIKGIMKFIFNSGEELQSEWKGFCK
ncbi:DUF1573 domain-containing protein [bacterium]|nr:DUF1573 domain-containing protein [bacterium]